VRVEQAAPHHMLAGPVVAHRTRQAPAGCSTTPPPTPLPAGAIPLRVLT
jgi:hypothetical protein